MRKFFLIVLPLFFFGLTSNAPGQETISLKVRGIDIGASYQTVILQFGKPFSMHAHGDNPCGSKNLTLYYPGLIFTLDGETGLRDTTVISIEVTAPKYSVAPQIGVGASLSKVRSKFGQNGTLTKESGGQKLSYFIADGYANFYFRKNKLVKAVWEMNLC